MGFRVAVVGATGEVGRVMLQVLEQRNFPVDRLRVIASPRSAGKTVLFRGREYVIEALDQADFERGELVLESAGGSTSKAHSPRMAAQGAIVIDNSSAFRMNPDVPLVVPEVNAETLRQHKGIIANPNCSTIQMVVALAPLHRAATLTRLIVSTYQSVSGKGHKAVEELQAAMHAWAKGEPLPMPTQTPQTMAFNCITHNWPMCDNGYSEEEMKMVNETRKIMGIPDLPVTATTVRVPSIRSHAESIYIETRRKLTAGDVIELLRKAPGIRVIDDRRTPQFPTSRDAADQDDTLVGRIREDLSVPNGLCLWCVADNLRKGAATNAIQIAEKMAEMGLLVS